MSEPRRHHYVPQFLIREFAGRDRQVYVLKREGEAPIHVPRRRPPKSAFHEFDLYAMERADGTKDQLIESKFLSRVDEVAARVYREIVRIVRQGSVPTMSEATHRNFMDLYRLAFSRAPDALARTAQTIDVEEAVRRTLQKVEEAGGDVEAERARLNDPKVREREFRNAIAQARVRSAPETVNRIARLKILFGHCHGHDRRFVLSDRMIDGAGLLGEDTKPDPAPQLWFPIAPDVAFKPIEGRNQVRVLSIEEVHAINRRLYLQSRWVAATAREQLARLAREIEPERMEGWE